MLSGYGMTEATGGITMTPVGDYIKNSVGKALPGIKLRIDNDGELCIKGNYVSKGYYKENKSNIKTKWTFVFCKQTLFELHKMFSHLATLPILRK